MCQREIEEKKANDNKGKEREGKIWRRIITERERIKEDEGEKGRE